MIGSTELLVLRWSPISWGYQSLCPADTDHWARSALDTRGRRHSRAVRSTLTGQAQREHGLTSQGAFRRDARDADELEGRI